MDLVLPATVFFRPNGNFTEWARLHLSPDSQIYDVGSGCGHVTAALFATGLTAWPIDLHRRQGAVVQPLVANAIGYPYVPGSAVLICRPCHNGFTEFVVDDALALGCSVFYVGLERNLELDLPNYLERVQVAPTEPRDLGEEGERAWRVWGQCRGR